MEQSENSSYTATVPSSGWALANIISLATESNSVSGSSGCFVQGLDCEMYVHAVNHISENFLTLLDKSGKLSNKGYDEYTSPEASSSQEVSADSCHRKVKLLFVELLKPVHQQWHLRELMTMTRKNNRSQEEDIHATTSQSIGQSGHIKLLDIVYFYCYMLRIFSILNPFVGSLPILNLLSFTPGFLPELWEKLEDSIFHGSEQMSHAVRPCRDKYLGNYDEAIIDRRQRPLVKETGNKWMNVLHKIAGKSADVGFANSGRDPISFDHVNEDASDLWDIEAVRIGPQGISKDLLNMLHLFCATYAHLLLVLDDIEFYDKQVPFTLQQQQKIASVLNTLVYNSFLHSSGLANKHIMDAAVRCLHLLYERDCRHNFCSPSLWLDPARKGRIPIVAAARAHEAAFTNLHSGDTVSVPSMSSILTTIPHVYPFEERVQMFREFIKLDRVAGRAAGEVSGPYSGSIDIVVHRDKIVEDGYRQLNFLGSRLKSCINVSFVSEFGLPEAGLDYGGLSKEFLTDLSKAAFGPKYGLFTQSSTSECNLIPNLSARMLDNGIEMFEFLGRIVGKALYEGILLDYSFSLVFVQKLLGRYSFLDELSALDSELYRNLIYVKHYDGDVAELSLDFTVTEEICGKCTVIELRPNGKNLCVTNDNKLQYIHAMADYKLNRQILPFANAFYRGLVDLISPSWLSLFNANEFNQLLSGGNHDFDVEDLRRNTRYTGGYSERSRTVKLFWEVIGGFRPTERCMLLKFVTSCSRPPLLGFTHLQPSFTIHKVACDVPIWASVGGQDVDRLPSASTCYNTLKLPTYKRASTLRTKLLYAISSNTGFELS